MALVAMLLAWALGLGAEQTAPRVSLLTVSPGPLVYELDGHTAMRFQSPGGQDYVVNWGVFDFSAPNFLYRFVKGETDYMAWPFPFETFMEEYRRQGREVTEQVLDLTPAQARRLEALVAHNLRPENRTYRYNYIYDNCATRPLAFIQAAVDRPVEIPDFKGFRYGETSLTDSPGRHTFREEMTRAHADYPWYQFGIDLALGSGLDKEITPKERTYSPLYLKEALRRAKYIGSNGEKRQLVKSTAVILPARGRVTESPTPAWLSPIAVTLAVMLLSLWVAISDIRHKRISRWYDSLTYGCFFIVSLLLTFLIFISVHEATSPNWLYLWLNPLTAIPAALVWIKSCGRVVYCYHICNFVALFLLLAIGIIGIQALNTAFYPLILADMALSARYLLIRRADKPKKTTETTTTE